MNTATINNSISQATTQPNVGKQLLVLYGELNQQIIISAIRLTEQKLIFENVPANVITKTKIVCIEMLQNILKHQKKVEAHLPNFIVRLTNDSISIVACNVISEKSKMYISTQLDAYAKEDNFRAVYLKAFEGAAITDDGNAGLGLIDIVYRAKQNFTYTMEQLSPDSFSFNLDVTIPQSIISAN